MLNRLASWWERQPIAGAEARRPQLHHVTDSEPRNGVFHRSALAGAGEGGQELAAEGGLLDEPELRDFFSVNHFGLGRHNGATYRTREALERGRAGVIARFCNSLERVAHRRESRLRRLNDTLLEIEGVSQTTSRRIKQAVDCLERDKATLEEQVASATRAEGWVAQAVIEYETGFAKGVYEAVTIQVHGKELP